MLPGSPSMRASGTWSATAPTPWLASTAGTGGVLTSATTRSWSKRAGSARSVEPARCVRPAPGSSPPRAAARREAEHSTGSQHRRDGRQGSAGFLDHLEHLVTDDQVGARRPDQVEEIAGITLHSRDGPLQALLGGPTLEGGECVGTGVDDSDLEPVAPRPMAIPPVPPPRSTTARPAESADQSASWASSSSVRYIWDTDRRRRRSGTSPSSMQVRRPGSPLRLSRPDRDASAPPRHREPRCGRGSRSVHTGASPDTQARITAWARTRGSTRSSPSTESKSRSNQETTLHAAADTRSSITTTARRVVTEALRPVHGRSRTGHSPQPIANTSNGAAIGTPSRVPVGRAPPSRNSRASKNSQPRPSM